jgi:hypothetical protein
VNTTPHIATSAAVSKSKTMLVTQVTITAMKIAAKTLKVYLDTISSCRYITTKK